MSLQLKIILLALVAPTCLTFHSPVDLPSRAQTTSVNNRLGSSVLPATLFPTFATEINQDISIFSSNLEHQNEEGVIIFASKAIENNYQCEGYILSPKKQEVKSILECHIKLHDGSINHFFPVLISMLLHILEIEDMITNDGNNLKVTFSYEIPNDHPDFDSKMIASWFDAVNDLGIKTSSLVQSLNLYTLSQRGTDKALSALQLLEKLSKRRNPFDWKKDYFINDNDEKNIISLQQDVLSSDIVNQINEIVYTIRKNNWLSTNPDSVDGLPSLHLNLISNGKALFESDVETNDGSEKEVTFEKCVLSMIELLEPILNEKLLPSVQKLTNSKNAQISDVFIRNYGNLDVKDASNGESEERNTESKTRYTLSPHYDITAFATCVVALDSTAETGRNGLYTVPTEKGFVSNNAALRKFFPLKSGNGVVHSYDILHGVDVDPTLVKPRTSLIVWFTEKGSHDKDDVNRDESVNQPWLLNPKGDIGQFILGLASDCNEEEDGSHLKLKESTDRLSLYISSSSKGNCFAITQLAQMCDDGQVNSDHYQEILTFLIELDPLNPYIPHQDFTDDDTSMMCQRLAPPLWFYASVKGGNRIAQVSLADEIMLQYMTKRDSLTTEQEEDMLMIASSLFTMASFQGHDASYSLQRLMEVNCQRLANLGVIIPSEEFLENPVTKILLMSIS